MLLGVNNPAVSMRSRERKKMADLRWLNGSVSNVAGKNGYFGEVVRLRGGGL